MSKFINDIYIDLLDMTKQSIDKKKVKFNKHGDFSMQLVSGICMVGVVVVVAMLAWNFNING